MAGARVSTQILLPMGAARTANAGADEARFRRRYRGSRLRDDDRRLRPRGVGELLDISAELFVERFALYVGIASIIWLPFQLGYELVLATGNIELDLLWGVMAIFPQLFTTAVICSLVGGSFLEQEIGLGEALRVVVLRIVGVGIIAMLTAMASVALICPCIITAQAPSWLFGVAPAAYILERDTTFSAQGRAGRHGTTSGLLGRLVDVFGAMGRSVRLVWGWGNFGRWVGWTVVVGILTFPFSGATEGLRQPAARDWMAENLALRGAGLELFLSLMGALFLGVGTAYAAVVMTMYYLDTRVRREGLDLELDLKRLRDADGEDGAEAPA